MLPIDLKGKRALVAGVADDGGLGFAIAKALATAGASVCVGTWPPALGIFETLLRRGKLDASLELSGGGKLEFEAIYPLDAEYDTLAEVPEDVRAQKRYRDRGDFSVQGMVDRIREDFGENSLDIVVHSLANGPEVTKPLLETSRRGYLAAVGASAYSFVSLVQRVQPVMRSDAAYLALSYLASQGVVADYGGGMASAKAALEADARMLAFEVGRERGHRVNIISAGPYASRAATAIGFIHKMIRYYELNAPLSAPLVGEEVGHAAAFLCSPLASGITGSVVYVDKGYHAMAAPADVEGLVDAVSDPSE
ncbi:MAG: enoyl-[acyl-carrier-protein] reductase [Myxococcota bacterium]